MTISYQNYERSPSFLSYALLMALINFSGHLTRFCRSCILLLLPLSNIAKSMSHLHCAIHRLCLNSQRTSQNCELRIFETDFYERIQSDPTSYRIFERLWNNWSTLLKINSLWKFWNLRRYDTKQKRSCTGARIRCQNLC